MQDCFCYALILASLIATSASTQPVPDRDTLLLLQFNQSADADYALGAPSVDLRATRKVQSWYCGRASWTEPITVEFAAKQPGILSR